MANIKVNILKKTQDAPYPEHILIEKGAGAEMAHLYFDHGSLSKFVYIQKEDSHIQMKWDRQKKKYVTDLSYNPYKVKAAYNIRENIYRPAAPFTLEDTIPAGFCTFKHSRKWNESTITFSDISNGDHFVVLMDLQGKCKPGQYTEGWGADVKTVYPHQRRRTCPTPAFLKKERT